MTPQQQSVVLEAREILASFLNQNPIISSWNALLDYCHVQIANSPIEVFHVLYLDRKNRLIEDDQHGRGTVDHTPVYPREVAKRALEVGASAVILVHNHPSGDPTPSHSDVEMTNQLIDALNVFNIVVHDHLIIGGATELSFRSEGLLS